MSTSRRFIAGATCPKCKAIDRIVLHRRGEQQRRECVACGFSDDLQQLGAAPELTTRVTPAGSADSAQRVELIDLSKRKSEDGEL